VKRDVRALRGEREPDGAAESLARARHEDDLSRQSQIHCASDTNSAGV